MNPTRICVISATAAALAWAAKGLAIGLAGGLDKSPAEGPLFFAGLACFLLAACSLALSAFGRSEWWARCAVVAGTLAAVVVMIGLVSALVGLLAPSEHWVWEEASLWLAAAALLVVTVRHATHRRSAREIRHRGPDPARAA